MSTRKYLPWLPHLLALLALFWLAGGLSSVNPVQDLLQRSGQAAISLLLGSLTCRPLSRISRQRGWLALRRSLGLYAFTFATIHLFIFLGADYGFRWAEIGRQLLEKPFIWSGGLAFLLLLALALTSSRAAMRRLRKNWKRLHRSVYLAAILAVLHFGLARKANFFSFRGDALLPSLYLLALALLLGLRLPRPSTKK